MSKTESNMLALGTLAPEFILPNVLTGSAFKFSRSQDYKATVIMFICNHCPYVKHVNKELSLLANDFSSKDVLFLAINANDISQYPDDSPENMILTAKAHHYPFPYLFDETQEVAKAFKAACTPDFYVFDQNNTLVYRGQLDNSRPGNNIPVTGQAIREALNCILSSTPLKMEQKPSMGCNIKWKPVAS